MLSPCMAIRVGPVLKRKFSRFRDLQRNNRRAKGYLMGNVVTTYVGLAVPAVWYPTLLRGVLSRHDM